MCRGVARGSSRRTAAGRILCAGRHRPLAGGRTGARQLRSRLPDYMVPAAFVSMESFPLTPSGKINRRALPAPDETRPELETAYAPPRTGLEEQLSAIWCEVLGLQRVGSHDDFFALGGHSLLAVRLFAEIDKRLECRLPLAVLFQRPTIAGLAQAIAAEPPGESRADRWLPFSRCGRSRRWC